MTEQEDAVESALLDLRILRVSVVIDLDHVRDVDGISPRATVSVLRAGHIAGSTTHTGEQAVRVHALVREQILGLQRGTTPRQGIAGRIWHHITRRTAG